MGSAIFRPRWLPKMVLGAIGNGDLIELVLPLAGRSREFAALLADALGAGMVAALGMVLRQVWGPH